MNRLFRLIGFAFLALAINLAHAGAKEDIQADMLAGRWAQADARLEVVLKKHPDNALAHYWRAQVKAKQGDLAAAKDALESAKRIDPSLTFASKPELLADLERKIGASTTVEVGASLTQVPRTEAPTAETSAKPAAVDQIEPFISLSTLLWLMAGIAAAIAAAFIIGFVADRRDAKRTRADELNRWRAGLERAKADLDDAILVSDGSDAAPEKKLATYDRCNRLRAEIAGALSAPSARVDFDLIRRAHDVAAGARNEETPTARSERLDRERQEREDRERARWASEAAARRKVSPAPSYSSHDTGGGLLTGALIGGAAMMLATSSSSASEPRQDYSSSIDIGGSSSSSDVDVGGSDSSSSSSGGFD